MTDNASRVLAALQRTTTARRIDLMRTCHMTRGEVHEALDELRRDGLVNSIASGARFMARSSICPPLADATQQGEQGPCETTLCAVAHIADRE